MNATSQNTASAAPPESPGLREELAQVWRELPHKPPLLLLLAGWGLLFHFLGNSTFGYTDTPSLFSWLNFAYQMREDDQHGYLIPFIVLGLLWWKREEILRLPLRTWWPALLIIALALLLHAAGFIIQQTRVSLLAFFIGIYGLTGLLWGWRWLQLAAFPFAFLVFCVPLGSASEFITFPLRMLTSQFSVGFCQWFLGMDVIRDGTRIFSPDLSYQYDVAPACSGIRSLFALGALTTIYGYVTFNKWWQRGVMILVAAPLAVLGNFARITTVIIAGELFGHEAGAWVEQKLGLITFVVALGLALLVARWLERYDRKPPHSHGVLSQSPA
jgi:exosortase